MADYLVDIMPKRVFGAPAQTLVPVSTVEPLTIAEEPEVNINSYDDSGVELDDVAAHKVYLDEMLRMDADADLQADLAYVNSVEFDQDMDTFFSSQAGAAYLLSTDSLIGDARAVEMKKWREYGLSKQDANGLVKHFRKSIVGALILLRNQVLNNAGPLLSMKDAMEGWQKAKKIDNVELQGKKGMSQVMKLPHVVTYLLEKKYHKELKKLKDCGDDDQRQKCKYALVAAVMYVRLYNEYVLTDEQRKQEVPAYLSSTALKKIKSRDKTYKSAFEAIDTMLENKAKFGLKTRNAMRQMAKKTFILRKHTNAAGETYNQAKDDENKKKRSDKLASRKSKQEMMQQAVASSDAVKAAKTAANKANNAYRKAKKKGELSEAIKQTKNAAAKAYRQAVKAAKKTASK